jgi:hypothetical protein
MLLKYCSISGPDNKTDPAQLYALAEKYPFAEWAILFSPERAGNPRFPTMDWIERFKRQCRHGHKALHLCEGALPGFIKGDPEILGVMNGFSRIQLNLGFGNRGPYSIDELVDRVRKSPNWQFIIQHGKEPNVLPLFENIPNHAVLFDASAGSGQSPESWPHPLAGRFCGYAGGLNPDNFEHHLAVISHIVPAAMEIWTDTETGVRTNNQFDITKASRMLEIGAPHAGQPQPDRQTAIASRPQSKEF